MVKTLIYGLLKGDTNDQPAKSLAEDTEVLELGDR